MNDFSFVALFIMKQNKLTMVTLPNDIVEYIWQFSPDHREKLNTVLEELDDYFEKKDKHLDLLVCF